MQGCKQTRGGRTLKKINLSKGLEKRSPLTVSLREIRNKIKSKLINRTIQRGALAYLL